MKKIVLYTLLISLMVLIFVFSSESSIDSGKTSGMVTKTIVCIFEKLSNHEFSMSDKIRIYNYLSIPIRKCAHFTLYFILGVLFYALLNLYNIDNKRLVYLILLFCTVYACSDEFHQLFVPGRAGKIIDVCIDVTGSLFGIFVCSKLKKVRKKV